MRKLKPKASREVRAWMAREGIMARDLEQELGLVEQSGMVTHFVNGDRTSARIRKLFIEKGCPARLLRDLEMLRNRKLIKVKITGGSNAKQKRL